MSYETGKHEAKPLDYQFGKSAKKGTEMVSVTFRFVDGPNKDKKITWSGYFTEGSAKRTMDALEYCGWDGIDLSNMAGFGSKNVELVIEPDENPEYQRVAWVNRLSGGRGPATVYAGGEVKSLAERMAALNAERRRENAEKRGVDPTPDPFGNG